MPRFPAIVFAAFLLPLGGGLACSQEGKADVPEKYRERYEKGLAWLDSKLAEWKPATYRPTAFAGYMIMSSENAVENGSAEVDSAFLDLYLKELDVDVVIMAVYPYLFPKYKARYEAIFKRVREAKKKLYVSYMIGAVPRTFEEYAEEEKSFAAEFVRACRPDYYVVVDEYTTMERRGGFQATEARWKALVEEVLEIVKTANKDTKTVATGHAMELEFLKSLTENGNLDAVGLNVWGTAYIGQRDDRFAEFIEHAKSKGKEIVFEQTWAMLLDEAENRAVNNMAFMEVPNARYIKVLAYFAQRHAVDVYAPFYTLRFFSHDTSDPAVVKTAIREKRRSGEFRAYQEIIAEVRRGSK